MAGINGVLGQSKDIYMLDGNGNATLVKPELPSSQHQPIVKYIEITNGGGGGGNPPAPDITSTLGMGTQDLINEANASKDKINNIIGELGSQKVTGSGAGAATGTEYSWDAKGANKANTQLQMDVNAAKQEALAQRQTIEQNAQAYQQQADMMKYSANQSAQSAGWTGGYVLDQNRQMEYLKSSIQSQMYGAMELQKYGYDTALAAARLSYDLNQQEFAHQYYMDAVNVAVTEAQQTGYYISAEVRDMMSQYNIAQEKLAKDPNDEQAATVTQGVKDWFKANFKTEEGKVPEISDVAVKTLSLLTTELNAAQSNLQMYMNTYFEQLTRIQAADSAAAQKLKDDSNAVIIYDPDTGEPKYNPNTGRYEIAYLNTMEPKDIIDYAKTNNETLYRVYGHLDSLIEESLYHYDKKLKDEDGKILASTTEEGIKKYLEAGNKDTIEAILKEAAKEKAFSSYSYSIEIGDATVIFSVDAEGRLKTEIFKPTGEPTDEPTDEPTNTTNLINTSGVNDYNWVFDGTGDDASVTFNNNKYNVTVVWSNYSNPTHAGLNVKDAAKKLNELYPNAQGGAIAYYNNQYWVYRKTNDIWGLIVQGDSQDKKAKDAEKLIEALKPTIDAQNSGK